MLRASPTFTYIEGLAACDEATTVILVEALNVSLEESLWKRANLPIAFGGLSIRRSTDLAAVCYAASLIQFGSLAESLVNEDATIVLKKTIMLADATMRSQLDPGPLKEHVIQHFLDACKSKKSSRDIMDDLTSPRERAVFLAAQHPFSGGWLQALPSRQLGTMLDPNSFRMVSALRIGAPVCEPFSCLSCSQPVDSDGLHPLSCLKSPGRLTRHAELNAIVRRALRRAGIPSTPEPKGLYGSSELRPDGVTIPLWSHGKSLAWDVTVSCTAALSYLRHSAVESGWVAERADSEKRGKYLELSRRYHFVPIALETLGPISTGTAKILKDIGKRIEDITGDRREAMFLRQMMSLAVCRGNVASIIGAMN